LVQIVHLDSNLIRLFSVVVIAFFGVTMLIPRLLAWTELFISRISVFFGQKFKKVMKILLVICHRFIIGNCVVTLCRSDSRNNCNIAATGQVSFTIVLVTAAYVWALVFHFFFLPTVGNNLLQRLDYFFSHGSCAASFWCLDAFDCFSNLYKL